MKRFTILFLLFLGSLTTAVCAQETPVCPLGDDYEFAPDLSDEFDGDALDETKWFDFNPAWRGRRPSLYSRDAVSVADGTLRLTASQMKPEEIDVEMKARGYDKYWNATIKSKRKLAYGYYEARCKSMNACVCNAFWLYDPFSDRPDIKYVEGESSEEIDVLECCGKFRDGSSGRIHYATALRYGTPYLESIVNKSREDLPNGHRETKTDFDFWADYHTFALAWTPESLRWFVDGKEVFSRENDYYNRPLHIVLDCEVIPFWLGEPDPADLPATFSVDYVRVWRLKDAPEPQALPEPKKK